MLILAYCTFNEENINHSLGEAEYSYYFVYRQFLNVLARVYWVIPVLGAVENLERLYQDCLERGEDCFCLFFSPPHKIPSQIACPIIPVFAWEFDSLPRNMTGGMDQDWGWGLARHGWAITHSSYSVNCVKDRIRADFPVISIPSPVWDDYQRYFSGDRGVPGQAFLLHYRGTLIDSTELALDHFSPESWKASFAELMTSLADDGEKSVSIEGIVYLSVLNPYDQRKNWQDMLRAFCWQFKQTPDTTLILKFSHKDTEQIQPIFLRELYKLSKFSCRVLVIHGYLEEESYSVLIKNSAFVVNASHGEGQCLPLMEGMSAGKPAIAPDHSAMGDYIRPDNAFIVGSSVEPTFWPHDPRQRLKALQYRIDWQSLCAAFQNSYRMIKERPDDYRKLSLCAHKTMEGHCSNKAALRQIKHFLAFRRSEYRSFDRQRQARSYSLKTRIRQFLRPLKRRLVSQLKTFRILS